MRRKSFLISLVLVILLASCTVRGNKVPMPPSGAKKASQLQVTSYSEAYRDEALLFSLSPDGKWFLGQKLEAICIFDASSMAEKVCASWKTSLDPLSITWSYDSQHVAFTENLPGLTESDIWVFDIPTGTLSNLTNDGLEGDLSTSLQSAQAENKDIYLDSVPAWSPDGNTLAFVRSTYGSTKQTFLCLIPATGGAVNKLIIADDQHSLAVWRGMRWTPDGKKILFTITLLDDPTGKNGIWIIDKNGKNYKQLVKEKEGWGYVVLYDVSPKGDKALIGYPRAILRAVENPNLSFYELVDIKTGKITSLREISNGNNQPDGQVVFYSPTWATFSPDGSKILYQYNQGSEDQPTPLLVVRDVNGTQEQVLGGERIYLGEDVGSSLFWALNDTIYMMTGPGLGILYTLGSK